MTLIFDTLGYARRMESAGFTRSQAEALAEEQARLIDERLATKTDIAAIQASIEALRLATKEDIEALRLATAADIEKLRLTTQADTQALRLTTQADIAGVKKDIEALRLTTQADIASVKKDIEVLRVSVRADMELLGRSMVIRLGGIVIASAAAVSTIVTLLSRLPLWHP